ncbi:flagellar basal body rod C-terminal domain-containing protein, partial [Helicobacter sp. UBA3407]
EGLQGTENNLYAESPNSGDPTFGPAGTGGRANIQASKLEMSNTDLSRGLTQLIVVQRGFQASSKSVTTSDQILNTLLQLKQ